MTTMSSGAASSIRDATARACSNTASAAWLIADPPSWSERDPPVPPPRGISAVSDCSYRIRSSGMPSLSDTIIANDVAWPCPCDDVPARTVALPSACTSTKPYSVAVPPPVTSTYDATPMPSCIRSPRARRSAWSARSAA